MNPGAYEILLARRRKERIAGWVGFVVLAVLAILYSRRTVSASGSDFHFSTNNPMLFLDDISHERGGRINRLVFNLCLRHKSDQIMGFSFEEILITPSEADWASQLFRGEGADRWSGTIRRSDLSSSECIPLLFGFPKGLKASDRQVGFDFRVKYAVASQKGGGERLVVDRNRTAEGSLKVREKVLVDLLTHRFLWESIFGKRRGNLSPSETYH